MICTPHQLLIPPPVLNLWICSCPGTSLMFSFHGSRKRPYYSRKTTTRYLQTINKELVFTNSWEMPVGSLQIMVTEWIGGFGLRLIVTCLNGEGGGALAGLEIQCKQVPLISKFRQLTNRLLILMHLIILYHLLLEQPDSQVS